MIPRIGKKPTSPALPKPSNITSFTHDPATGHLDVTFHGNRTYRYRNVSKDTAQRLRDAPSQGSFLNSHIIPYHPMKRLLRD